MVDLMSDLYKKLFLEPEEARQRAMEEEDAALEKSFNIVGGRELVGETVKAAAKGYIDLDTPDFSLLSKLYNENDQGRLICVVLANHNDGVRRLLVRLTADYYPEAFIELWVNEPRCNEFEIHGFFIPSMPAEMHGKYFGLLLKPLDQFFQEVATQRNAICRVADASHDVDFIRAVARAGYAKAVLDGTLDESPPRTRQSKKFSPVGKY